MKVTAVIPAAGSGKRLDNPGSATKKQFLEINGRSVLSITVSVFDECQSVDDIIVVVSKEEIEQTKELLKEHKKVKSIIAGGPERQDSVYNGIETITPESDEDIVVIHDGVRPLVTKEMISSAVTEAKVSKAVVVGVPAKDTIKTVSREKMILETLDRGSIWLVQTPQAFQFSVIKEAYERAKRIKYAATDDSKLVERMRIPVKMIPGSYENIKITTMEDLAVAEAILKGRGN
ncbi:MAG: 2-C-methyl-D-erythritol 4-phosphate cytidylyltransferase [bacterium]